MGDSHRDNRGGFGGGKGGRDFGNRGGFGGGRDGGKRDMFPATCAKCGRPCEVPFRPNGEKPVYCGDCFKNKDGLPRREEGRNFEKPSFNSRPAFPESRVVDQHREEFRVINDKLDKILKTLAKDAPAPVPAPKADKPEVKKEKVAAAIAVAVEAKKPAQVKEATKPKKAEKKAAAGKGKKK
ncbi:MAG: CxxC-x17-CxxC domain-containing protein [Candidatus Paceibacterota bacterium]|jgi:CxxC-x17-CxxC domain-containing protein